MRARKCALRLGQKIRNNVKTVSLCYYSVFLLQLLRMKCAKSCHDPRRGDDIREQDIASNESSGKKEERKMKAANVVYFTRPENRD